MSDRGRRRAGAQWVARAGLAIASVVLVTGLHVARRTDLDASRGTTDLDPSSPADSTRSADGAVSRVTGDAILLGVLVLAATPCVRVLALAVIGTRERGGKCVAVAVARSVAATPARARAA